MTSGQWAVGLMTGTVLDGEIDIALIRTDGEQIFEFGYSATEHYSTSTCTLIANAVNDARIWNFQGPHPESFRHAEVALTEEQSQAVVRSLKVAGLAVADINLIGFQAEECGQTLQLADGKSMALQTGIDVVHDFRSMDMSQGGEGAPLVPVYHKALLSRAGLGSDVVIVNLGGVANLTWWDGSSRLLAFDCGPANAPINDWVSSLGAGSYDVNGKLAMSGKIDEERLQKILNCSYFERKPPKSLDRNEFSEAIAGALAGMSVNDGAALLSALCAAGVERSLRLLPVRPRQILLCGGGRHNKAIVRQLQMRTSIKVDDVDILGWRGDALEAECFAYLASRVKAGLPTSFPSTTGCRVPVCGGVMSKAY